MGLACTGHRVLRTWSGLLLSGSPPPQASLLSSLHPRSFACILSRLVLFRDSYCACNQETAQDAGVLQGIPCATLAVDLHSVENCFKERSGFLMSLETWKMGRREERPLQHLRRWLTRGVHPDLHVGLHGGKQKILCRWLRMTPGIGHGKRLHFQERRGMQGCSQNYRLGGSIKPCSVLEDMEQMASARGEAWRRLSRPAALPPQEPRASAAGAPGAAALPAGTIRMGAISLCPGHMCPAPHPRLHCPISLSGFVFVREKDGTEGS